MKLVVIDLDKLEKEIHQHETLAMNAEGEQRDTYAAISHALQRVRSTSSSIELHVTSAYKMGFNQCLINKLKEQTGEAREFQEESLERFKKENGYI